MSYPTCLQTRQPLALSTINFSIVLTAIYAGGEFLAAFSCLFLPSRIVLLSHLCLWSYMLRAAIMALHWPSANAFIAAYLSTLNINGVSTEYRNRLRSTWSGEICTTLAVAFIETGNGVGGCVCIHHECSGTITFAAILIHCYRRAICYWDAVACLL